MKMTVFVKRAFLCCFLLLISSPVFCQFEGKKLKSVPYKYQNPHLEGDRDTAVETHFAWIVFSDRDNNITYDNYKPPQAVKLTINFMESFYVLEEKGEFLHIFRDGEFAATEKALSATAVDCGWIEKSRLLLSKRSLLNQQNVSVKAMLLNTIEYAKEEKMEAGQAQKVKFYKDPGLKILAEYTCDIFSIFYVYKANPSYPEKSKSVLLGMNYRMEGTEVKSIVGWVDTRRLTLWDHRATVLPNTFEDALKERQSKDKRATVFPEKDAAIKYRDNLQFNKNDILIINLDSFKRQNQYKAYFMRFPVLTNRKTIEMENGIMQIGAIGPVESSSGKCDQFCWAEIQKIINENKAKARHINIVFIIDGTKSMQPFFTEVSEGIIESMNSLNTDTKNEFKFAAVVYRDKDDGDLLMEPHTLTKSYMEIASWLRNIKAMDTGDKDAPEAMFYGIKMGLRRIALPEDQTNYVILVGDAGDHERKDETTVPAPDVINLLYELNCNFIAFQVHNANTKPYFDFLKQTENIINALAGKYYQRNKVLAEQLGIPVEAPVGPTLLSYNIDRKWELKNSPMISFVMQPKAGTSLTQNILKKEVVQAIYNIKDTTDDLMNAIQTLSETGGLNTLLKGSGGGLMTYLSRLNIPTDNLKILADEHYQLYYKGFTAYSTKGLTNPLWQYDLLYSRDELNRVVNYIEMLPNASTITDLRNCFFTAWIEILKSELGGQRKSTNELENMGFDEIEELVFGGVGSTDLLNNKLRDIKDPAKIPDKELIIWQNNIDKRLKKLKNILNTTQTTVEIYSFLSSSEERFFWIPQTFLP
jgi:hypothetical protein